MGNVFMYSIVILVLLILLVGFFVWQITLTTGEEMSCEGDWSYYVECPFGTKCTGTTDPLIGGICRPWISNN